MIYPDEYGPGSDLEKQGEISKDCSSFSKLSEEKRK
jgi:hypothetical protein